MRIRTKYCGWIALLTAVGSGMIVFGQQPGPEGYTTFIAGHEPRVNAASGGTSGGGFSFAGPRLAVLAGTHQALKKAAEDVQNAKDDDAKSAARKKLSELVDKAFEEDMTERQKELKQLEERLAKLREQLSRRKEKKQDIVDLQIKVLLNDADGLGFTSGDVIRAGGGPPNVSLFQTQPGAGYVFFNNDSSSAPRPTPPTPPAPPRPADSQPH